MQKYELRSILNIGSNSSSCSLAGVLVCSEQSSVLLKNAHDFPENFAKNVCGLFSGKKHPPGLFFGSKRGDLGEKWESEEGGEGGG